MHPLWSHLVVQSPSDQTDQQVTNLCQEYGQVLFVQTKDPRHFLVQMRYPLDALQAMYQLNAKNPPYQVSIEYKQKNALWFGNLPVFSSSSSEQQETLNEQEQDIIKKFLRSLVEELKIETLGIFVSPFHWAIVFIEDGNESRILALNNTWPSSTYLQEQKLNIVQPLKVNLWNYRSSSRRDAEMKQGIQVTQKSNNGSNGKAFRRNWNFHFSPFGKNVLQLDQPGTKFYLPTVHPSSYKRFNNKH
jgi:hypothetical protein